MLGVIAVVAIFRAAIIRKFGSGVFGWGEVLLGAALLCFAFYGWHVGHIGILPALGVGLSGYMLVGFGSNSIKKNHSPVAKPQFKPKPLPPQTFYGGTAKEANLEDVHEFLKDKSKISDNPTYQYDE